MQIKKKLVLFVRIYQLEQVRILIVFFVISSVIYHSCILK